MKSKLGLVFASVYIVVAAYLVVTQGLVGESFIAIILGLPWTLLLSFIEFGGAQGMLLYILLIVPMAINAFLLYKLGNFIGRRM